MKSRGGFWRDAAFGAVVAAACFGAFLVANQAHAEDIPEPPPAPLPLQLLECKLPGCALVRGAQVAELAVRYDDAVKRIAELELQLGDLKRSKGCAKLEVTEPPRNFVPNKERDS